MTYRSIKLTVGFGRNLTDKGVKALSFSLSLYPELALL